MNSAVSNAQIFRRLHDPNNPIVLYNIWDVGSAAAVARAGAKAIATGSWSVAAAQGYADGEKIPFDDALAIFERIARTVDLPVSVDVEGGYAADPAGVRTNVRRLLALGVVGLNFEDQLVNGPGLYRLQDQVARLKSVRQAADDLGVPAFINARTDVLLKAEPGTDHARLLDEVLRREEAYADAGADGFFVLGLADPALIRQLCERATLSINVMARDEPRKVRELTTLGVARISLGSAPYIGISSELERRANALVW